MAAVAEYLADKSALARLGNDRVYAVLGPLIDTGLVATCAVIELEMLWSTRTAAEFDRVLADRQAGYEWLPTEDSDWQRAIDVQQQLWASGFIRAVPLPDLLVAAVAGRHRVTVMHYDADYDRIAAITRQPTRWVVPPGSVS
jgi:predicted nucleic acid-binding protein